MTALLEVAPASGSKLDVHLEPKPGGARLGIARGSGPCSGRTNTAVAWILVEGGEGEVRAESEAAMVGGRSNVFDEPGWSALVPLGGHFVIEGPLRYLLAWRESDRDVPARVIPPEDVESEERGAGPHRRLVRTYVPEGPLICGETVTPPGGWSSWPPQTHDHEEAYAYRFDPPSGFGVALNYGIATEVARIVHDGQVQRISSGYHPVVTAPGYSMYYAWAAAGDIDTLVPQLDPVHAWTGQ